MDFHPNVESKECVDIARDAERLSAVAYEIQVR